MSRKPDLTKRVVALMDAIDKHAPTVLPKTEEQMMSLIQSLVRPIVRRVQAREVRHEG